MGAVIELEADQVLDGCLVRWRQYESWRRRVSEERVTCQVSIRVVIILSSNFTSFTIYVTIFPDRHAYSVLDVRDVHGYRLLQIRNPWGHFSWKGDWSENSDKWTLELRQILAPQGLSGGVFWISFDDVLKWVILDRECCFLLGWAWTVFHMKTVTEVSTYKKWIR